MPAVIERNNIPNLLTILRLVLAAAMFVLLAFYQFNTGVAWLLIPAFVLFIAAAITDALDGYYARKWEVVSKFGRIMDPFCDKVLVLGALVFPCGTAFLCVTPGRFVTCRIRSKHTHRSLVSTPGWSSSYSRVNSWSPASAANSKAAATNSAPTSGAS